MKNRSESMMQRITATSRNIFSSAILFLCLAGVISAFFQLLGLKWKWLEIVSTMLFVISVFLLAISWVTPGILIILKTPWLAHVWLRGINREVIWDKPWEQLSSIQKSLIYFWSILFFCFVLLAIIAFILQIIRRLLGWSF